jgi:hypothetical protein
MLNIICSDQARQALRLLLDKEKTASVCFRLREFAGGCVTCCGEVRRYLGLALDEPGEEDLMIVADSMLFVMEDVLVANYGNSFYITLDKNRTPVVTAMSALFSLDAAR